MKINLVMIVKNEERSLEQCLEQARGLVDEIVIADTGSPFSGNCQKIWSKSVGI
jgi:glycosyltransferase involved in cell wall biosynthesis